MGTHREARMNVLHIDEKRRKHRIAVAVGLVMAVAACDEPVDMALPTGDEVVAHYQYERALTAEINGNVATVFVAQDPQQLRRGGTIWAKMGPYIFLFSEESRALFEEYPGLAGLRVVTRVGNAEVASALLGRDDLSGVQWRRALNISGRARRDGSQTLGLLEDLITWGEDHTEYEYNPRYTSRR